MTLKAETGGLVALAAFPMHGQHKLSSEGYRTRDGHFIEWFGRILKDVGQVGVFSRPEPVWLGKASSKGMPLAANTCAFDSTSWRIPRLSDRQHWWVKSCTAYRYPAVVENAPIVTWNPFLASSNVWPRIAGSKSKVVFDLLDDWTKHYAFESVATEVDEAYRNLFARADTVTANAEGTVELAKRYGRDDVIFIPNGCDPGRFSPVSSASGPLTVGYVGKIGKRLDLELITGMADAHPDVSFVFAGPILDAEYRRPLAERANITLLGDVHYDDVPELLRTFDIGWVPHFVGSREVGGDVIKTYEYRAAGLPVLTTPVAGSSSRGLDHVDVLPASGHSSWLTEIAAGQQRLARKPSQLPDDVHWESKARALLFHLGLAGEACNH